MNPRPEIPLDTLELQARAADPRNSVWVSANAGSGKTHVLSRRVARLLLAGTEPSKILCLTYTRAAAANMANRVFKYLAEWAMADDAALGQKIEELEGERPNLDTIGRARKLFAKALETPGGLKIQTIHAFCESVLHQFPLEANIAAHFSMLDGAMEAALFADARRTVITGATAAGDAALAQAFGHVMECAGETGLEALLEEVMRERNALHGFVSQLQAACSESSGLYRAFGLDAAHEAASLAESIWPDPYFHRELAGGFAARAKSAGKAKAQEWAEHLISACDQPDPLSRLECLRKAFLTKNGPHWQAKQPGPIASKGVGEFFTGFAEEFARIAENIRILLDRIALLQMLHGTRAALSLAERLLARYEKLKTGRGFLDFNDLITRTARLLARSDAGPWVQYKLDQGIDHILLDEAQDTSPDQWIVVKGLAEDFFSGAGARGTVHRTIFAVGDEKQSIYSFQGAQPESFAETGFAFSRNVRAADQKFEPVKLSWSFRSTADVLAAVDCVFAPEDARRGLTRDPEPVGHRAVRAKDAGHVELWPSLGVEEVEEPDDWRLSVDHARAPAVRLAENIALRIKHWIENGDRIEGRSGRLLKAGDVMVLVRKRDRFVHALSRALKNHKIDVAGADRIRLPDHIAVKDLTALGRFLLQPEDDLSLAAVLRSPVFGLSEDELFALAAGRAPGQSLGEALRRAKNLRFVTIAAQLAAWNNEAAFKPVFEFYAAVLGRDGVRKRMVGRLGPEAGEILDEFLNFCLGAEQAGQAGLEALLATLDSAAPDIRREMDQNRDEVRIMTVHAAKGLEAPVVFLVDGGGAPFVEQHMPRLMAFDPPGQGKEEKPWQGKGFLWRFGSAVNNEVTRTLGAAVKRQADDEYRRLLYVGMTRAEDRLVVCGYHGKRGANAGSWHTLVARGLEASPFSHKRTCPVTGREFLHFRISPEGLEHPASAAADKKAPSQKPLPSALLRNLPAPEVLPRPLAPSGAAALIEPAPAAAVAGRSPVLDAQAKPSLALARGSAFHRLLEVLPGLPEAARGNAAERYLAKVGAAWPASVRDGLLRALEDILADPRFAPLFAQGSQAEVAITGTVLVRGVPRTVSGKIDRLAVTASDVLIVDYKTDRPGAASFTEVPNAYLVQLSLYRALLRSLYPTKTVSAAILFTESRQLIPLPAEAMDRVLAELAAEAE